MPRRALFMNPPLVLGADFIDYPWFANYGVLACAALTARAGWTVEVADAFALPASGKTALRHGDVLLGVPHRDYLDSLPQGSFDLVVIGTSPFLKVWSLEGPAAALIDEVARRHPAATVVLADCHPGGMHYVDYDGDAVLSRHPQVDLVVKYAGEKTFSNPDGLTGLKGGRLVIEDPDVLLGGFVPPFPLVDAQDQAAFGAFLWRVFEDGRWNNAFAVDSTTRPFMTSTGCPHRCTFCSSNPGWNGKGRKPCRSLPVEVVEQWAYLTSRLTGAHRLFILDEMANVRPDFDAMLRSLNNLGLQYEFPNGLRADRLDAGSVELMKDRVGLLCVSAETGTQADLDGPVGKRQDLAHVERVAREAMEVGIPTMVHFIVGFPWETSAHVQGTLELAFKLYEKYGAQPAVQYATPLPGTRLHQTVAEAGLLAPDDLKPGDGALFQHRPAFRPAGLPEGYLETAMDTLHQKMRGVGARKVIINITYECINKCAFCAVSNRVRKDIPWPRLKELIREHRDQGMDQIDLDGGEPTLHENLVDAVRFARDIGYVQVNVTTNGRRLQDPAVAGDLLESGVTSLLISLHGQNARVHDSVTRVPGSFKETLAGLRNVVNLRPDGVDFGVNTTLSRHNVDHVEAVADLLWEEGIRKVNFQLLTPFGAAGGHVVPPTEAAAGAVMRVIDRYGDRMNIQVINAQFCFFPGYESYLAGDVQKLGRSMVFVTEEEVNLFQYLGERRHKTETCSDCPWALICEGFHVFGEGESDVEP